MAGLCEHCVSGTVLKGTPAGAWITGQDGLMDAYYASAKANSTTADPKQLHSRSATLIITDVFGFDIPNPKIIADMLAEKSGQDFFVPDIFRGQ